MADAPFELWEHLLVDEQLYTHRDKAQICEQLTIMWLTDLLLSLFQPPIIVIKGGLQDGGFLSLLRPFEISRLCFEESPGNWLATSTFSPVSIPARSV